MIWEDMQLGPSGSPRPDVYTILKSYSRPLPTAYECKISVADFRSDVTSGKWQKYLQFAGAVIFCTPKGLVQKTDVPDGCGLVWFYPETGTFKTLKGPTFRAVSLPQDAMLKLLIDGVKRAHAPALEAWQREYALMQSLRKRLGNEVADFLRDKENARTRLKQADFQVSQKQARLAEIEQICSKRESEAVERGQRRSEEMIATAKNHRHSLCQALNLSDNATEWSIYEAIQALRDGLQESAEVRRLSSAVSEIATVLKKYAAHPAGTVSSVEVIA